MYLNWLNYILLNTGDIAIVSGTPQEVDATFNLVKPGWNDEPFITISSKATTPEGLQGFTVQKFGVGESNGIENDYYISE